MIKGFEEQTHELTSSELLLVDPVVGILKQAMGKGLAIKSHEIVSAVDGIGDGPRVRKIVNYIRVNGLIDGLIATSNGYYVTDNYNELVDYEASLLARAESIRRVASSIRQQRHRMLEKGGAA